VTIVWIITAPRAKSPRWIYWLHVFIDHFVKSTTCCFLFSYRLAAVTTNCPLTQTASWPIYFAAFITSPNSAFPRFPLRCQLGFADRDSRFENLLVFQLADNKENASNMENARSQFSAPEQTKFNKPRAGFQFAVSYVPQNKLFSVLSFG